MMNSTLIEVNSDVWQLYAEKSSYPYTFDFEYLPNEWFKKTVKQITLEQLQIGKLSLGTIHRYYVALKSFFVFIEEANYKLETFEDIGANIAEEYLHYLLVNIEANSTRSLKLAALKFHLKHGRILGWKGFPLSNLFDGTEYKFIQSEDTLKSMIIDDRVMKQIENALNRMYHEDMTYQETLIWGLITIIKETGMRIHEALSIKKEHISKDLMGKSILEVLNDKTQTDRYIPVSQEVVRAIRSVAKKTEWIQERMETDFIFVRGVNSRKRDYEYLQQYTARTYLKDFCIDNKITSPTGELYLLKFHQFRHTIGTDLLNNGMSMREVMDFLGHTSSHSTRLYAKIKSDRFSKTYRKLGFIGVIEEKVDDIVDAENQKISEEKRLKAQLPDGVCARPIKETVIDCKKPNACLFCPKFITTPEFLFVHKDHLERIQADKNRYMEENLIGTDYLLLETEKALIEIISQLENLQSTKGGNE